MLLLPPALVGSEQGTRGTRLVYMAESELAGAKGGCFAVDDRMKVFVEVTNNDWGRLRIRAADHGSFK